MQAVIRSAECIAPGVRHWRVAPIQPDLLAELPEGLQYRRDFISVEEERTLLEAIDSLEFATFEMRGVVARRRVAFFGNTYDQGAQRESPPIPAFLSPLRARLASWLSLEAGAFSMVLINEYRPGAPIGWHRDAPQYALVAGVSLLSACRMKFRPYVAPGGRTASGQRRMATHELVLDPRSAYVMDGPARAAYEHHIPAVTTLRYSITFRTLRSQPEPTV
jgi:alkylated DNA repair dioxygenase AlkB